MSSFNQKINQHANDETSQNLSAKLFNLKNIDKEEQQGLDEDKINKSTHFDIFKAVKIRTQKVLSTYFDISLNRINTLNEGSPISK